MKSLPTGTVTFLFTDIEGSTTLLQQLKDAYPDALMECRRLLRTAVWEQGGQEFGTEGDAVFAAFPSAREALLAAVAAQRAILQHPWPDGAVMKVRMGLHTGEVRVAEGDYVGLDVHRTARICAAAHGGQILLSDTAAALVTQNLPDRVRLRDLGEHRLKNLSHPLRLFQVLAPDLPTQFSPLRSLGARSHNLPVQLTSFIGREREIAEVKRLLGDARLVTLIGSGGAGKTRLALQVAHEVLNGYPDGVWLAEFAPIVDPALVPKTVAAALSLPEQPGRDMLETLVDALPPKALLLVLDNCEHLVAACADLAIVLLRACPQVRLLATSREALGMPGEILWRVPSLSLPDAHRLPPPEDLVLSEAVRLFVDRAMASASEFTVTRYNAPAVAQICQRLDGIPLAIELAAARVKVLAVEQIAARLDDRFQLLTGGSRTALPRQQTLRGTMDWSYALLSDKERCILRRLSVFAGGWTLEAAESVIAGGGVEPASILDLLTSLVDKSLVVTDTQRGSARYRMLETVRQYAHDRLAESDESGELRTRHWQWYLELAEHIAGELQYPQRGPLIERLETEHDNLRAALQWSSLNAWAEQSVRLPVALGQFWLVRGYFSEGRRWLVEAIERAQHKLSAELRAKALNLASRLAQSQADYTGAQRFCEESLRLCRELGDEVNAGRLLCRMGAMLVHQGDPSARQLLEESLAIATESGETRDVAHSLVHLGNLARLEADYETARRLCGEGLAFFRKLEDVDGMAWTLRYLGQATYGLGDFATARSCFEESLKIFRELNEQMGIAWVLLGLGYVIRDIGDSDGARSVFQESFEIFDKLGEKEGSGWSLCSLADVALSSRDFTTANALNAKGLTLFREIGLRPGIFTALARLVEVNCANRRPLRAARLIGATESLRDRLSGRHKSGSAGYIRAIDEVRGALGNEAFAAASGEGRAMTLEQAIEYALASGVN